MDFVGTGRRLAQGDVGDAARWLGVETAVLLSFMEVETAGRGFDKSNRPKMLFEPHVLYRELGAGKLRDRVEALGLAYARWGAKPYPKDSYPRLKQAIDFDATKAMRSASWGLSQILGSNHGAAGHPTVLSLVKAAMQGEREQLWSMVSLMKAWGMLPMLSGKDFTKADSWRQAASKWNGSGYAKHGYHTRMAAAYAKHTKGEPMVTPASSVLVRGMKGEAVRNLQADLAALGYEFKLGIDGRFGDETDANVRAFQKANKINVDGKAGDETLGAIAVALALLTEDKSPDTPEWQGQEKPAEPIPTVPMPAPERGGNPIVWIVLAIIVAAALGVIALFTPIF